MGFKNEYLQIALNHNLLFSILHSLCQTLTFWLFIKKKSHVILLYFTNKINANPHHNKIFKMPFVYELVNLHIYVCKAYKAFWDQFRILSYQKINSLKTWYSANLFKTVCSVNIHIYS